MKKRNLVWVGVAGMLVLHPLSVQAQQQQFYTLKVAPQDVDKIAKGLGNLPYVEVVDLIQNLRSQIINQQQPPKPAVVGEPQNEPSKP